MEIIGRLIVFLVMACIYLLPSIIAHKKQHKQKVPIILVNILLGWSMLGWAGALIWCFLKPVDVRNQGVADEIQKLNKLRADGALTEEEFQKQKNTLLGN